jgi:8-oxo-dGTP pyrophosphatase MutT (NUDIX family)
MSLLERIEACHRHDLGRFRAFRVGGERLGFVRHDLALECAKFPSVFTVEANAVKVKDHLATFDLRTAAIDTVVRELFARGVIAGWRNEIFPVAPAYGKQPLFDLERAAVPFFGVKAYGVHLNGYVRDGDRLKLWVGRRSADRPIEPGKLDHLVAGGLPSLMSPFDNLIKEAAEEAGIPKELARRARAAGALGYRMELNGHLRDDTIFVYDLELPADFQPRNHDGEIADFRLLPLEEVETIIATTDAFKFNVGLVVVDFMIRHGHIAPERADYCDLALALANGKAR